MRLSVDGELRVQEAWASHSQAHMTEKLGQDHPGREGEKKKKRKKKEW